MNVTDCDETVLVNTEQEWELEDWESEDWESNWGTEEYFLTNKAWRTVG